jgi:hypothetical protein
LLGPIVGQRELVDETAIDIPAAPFAVPAPLCGRIMPLLEDSYGFLRIPMDSYGFLRIPMDP